MRKAKENDYGGKCKLEKENVDSKLRTATKKNIKQENCEKKESD